MVIGMLRMLWCSHCRLFGTTVHISLHRMLLRTNAAGSLPSKFPAGGNAPAPLLLPRCTQGVPLRLELGPKDMDNGVVMAARRDNGAKQTLPWGELAQRVPQLLQTIQVRVGGVHA